MRLTMTLETAVERAKANAVADFTDGLDDVEDVQLAHDVMRVEGSFTVRGVAHVVCVNIDETYYLYTYTEDTEDRKVWWA